MNIANINTLMCANMIVNNTVMQNAVKAQSHRKVQSTSKTSSFDKDKEKHKRGDNK